MSSAALTSAIRQFGTAKEVAQAAGCSEATAARYRRGETMPDPISLARLMGRSREIAQAMLRLAGLDDLSMDIEEARLRRELHQLQAKRMGPSNDQTDPALGSAADPSVDTRGCVAKARDAMSDYALKRAEAALANAHRRSRR